MGEERKAERQEGKEPELDTGKESRDAGKNCVSEKLKGLKPEKIEAERWKESKAED